MSLQVDVRPRWPFRLGAARRGGDGLLRRRDGWLWRLLHVDGRPVIVRVRQPQRQRVVIEADATDRTAAQEAVDRMRFALSLDDDLRPFHERFRWDPLIGRALRADPTVRTPRHPRPFEALAWAVCEQLIEVQRAEAIQRRIVARLGTRCPQTGLRDAPDAGRLAEVATPLLESFDLSAGRARALKRAAREVAAGRVDLEADHATGWRRLRTIPGIGAWTVEKLALEGQGRYDQLPAGDLAYLKLVGRLTTGNPRARAEEEEVRAYFERYQPWSALAARYLGFSRGARVVG